MFLRLQDYNIFTLVFRWVVQEATNASQEQGISFLLVVIEPSEDFIQLQRNTFRGL